jgi:predicted DCC family thiol-disulfide oxidoreductase YuxK
MRGREPIVVFDGVCNFCFWGVRFILINDKKGRISFVPLQSPVGRDLLKRNGIDPGNPETFLLLKGGRTYARSDAVLEIARYLGRWRWLRVFGILPRGLRDWVYGVVARNRYKWFGKRDTCVVPTAEQRARFLDVPGA